MSLRLDWGARTYVMGIVNCTPDSFSGDGLICTTAAVDHGLHLVEEGADILDIGGESTRPGAEEVDEQEELQRVLPVIESLARRVHVPLSIDTSKAGVAKKAIEAGATVINDVWALQRDPAMASVAARRNATVVLMHNRTARATTGPLGGHYPAVQYEQGDIVEAVGVALEQRVGNAIAAGISRQRIIVDPGFGFGKTRAQNLELLRRVGELKQRPGLQGLPLLVGTSRKSFVGLTLGLTVDQRLEGTLATLALAVDRGADIVRVHDVQAAVRCIRLVDAVVRDNA